MTTLDINILIKILLTIVTNVIIIFIGWFYLQIVVLQILYLVVHIILVIISLLEGLNYLSLTQREPQYLFF